nr:hypothetical protein [uncultured Flavobacterium sp.]
MKKQFYYAILLVVLLVASCVNDGAGSETSYSPEDVWEYNGDVAVLSKVIKELKNGSNGKKLENTLLKNDVLWEESKFVFIDNKKRILVPFLSEDKNNVQGVLSLSKDADGKTTFDITDRYFSMRENSPLPFWDSGTWLGYIMALDKDILGKENGNPGVAMRIAKNNPKNVLTMRTECSTQVEEIVFYTYNYVLSSSGEVSNFSYSETRSEYIYKTVCYEVADPVVTNPGTGGTGGAPSTNNSGVLIPPSCESFNFVKTTGLWQVALVKNVGFKVFLVNDKGVEILHWIDFPKPISFGTPTNIQIGNTDITPGLAANASARALQKSMQDVVDRYGHTRTSDLTVSLYFQERLKHNYPLYIPGARVNFNATENIVATEYKTNTLTAGNCN